MRVPDLRGSRLFVLAVATVLVADQLTKWVVVGALEPGRSWPPPGTLVGRVFSFTHVYNTGVAFGMFQGRSNLLAVITLAVVTALLVYRQRSPADSRWLQLALGLQIGGALGNLIDRLRLGHVTDFLDFKIWPVFNIGDMPVVTGVLMLAWHVWRQDQVHSHGQGQEGGPPWAPALEERGD